MKWLTTKQLAELTGCTPEMLRRHALTMGKSIAKRSGKMWKFHPEKAPKWLDQPENAPKIANRQAVDIDAAEQAEPAAQSPDATDPLTQHIAMMQAIVTALVSCMRAGKIDPRIATMFKQCSSELRELIELQRKEREADKRLMDRETHRMGITTLARLIEQEGRAMANQVPDAMVQALSDGGIEFEDPIRAITLMAESARELWNDCLGRMADSIRKARREAGD